MGSPIPTRSNARREIGLICIDRLEHSKKNTHTSSPSPSLSSSLPFCLSLTPSPLPSTLPLSEPRHMRVQLAVGHGALECKAPCTHDLFFSLLALGHVLGSNPGMRRLCLCAVAPFLRLHV